MSINLGMAPAASVVCKVDKTWWPVKAAFIAKAAVSLSLISPTIIMSGSCLTRDRSPAEKVKPILEFTCVWFTLGILYSTGSSIVEILTSGVFKISIIA